MDKVLTCALPFSLWDYQENEEFKPRVVWFNEARTMRIVETHEKGSIEYVFESAQYYKDALGEFSSTWHKEDESIPWFIAECLRGALSLEQLYDPFDDNGLDLSKIPWTVRTVRGEVSF